LVDAILLYRKIPGQVGGILASPADFKIDTTGKITLSVGLQPRESVSILYSKHRIIQAGQLRSAYTHTIVPTRDNGLLNQVLTYSAYTFIPDSFYIRVETMGNFRGQLAAKYQEEAKASVASSGPRVDNASQPQLFEQGNKSIFFDEGEYANEDLVARITLKFYNDTINYLEDVLQQMDGRVVGDWDGRFKFDGSTGSIVSSVLAANNQIDDLVRVSVSFPSFLQAYKTSPQSRFYPTRLTSVGISVAGVNDGDQIFDLGVKPVTGTSPTFFRRFPRALIVRRAEIGDTTLLVDTTAGTSVAPFRVAFTSGMALTIADPSTIYLDPVTIGTVTPTSISIPALAAPIPAGATVYLSNTDTTYQLSYRIGFDVTLDSDNGFLLYVIPHPIFPTLPNTVAPAAGERLQGQSLFGNLSTSPSKFPALYGQTLDDSGDQRYPLVNPSPACESNPIGHNYLDTELSFVSPGGFLTPPYVENPFIGSGSLDFSRTVISMGVSFPSPVPQPGDIVRITSGLNAASNYHLVTQVFASSIVVVGAFSSQDTNFQFEVAVSNNLVSGTASTSANILTDMAATFISSGVKPGYTVVATRVGPTYQRRLIMTVDSETQLTMDVGFTTPLVGASYRICNPLTSFGSTAPLIDAVNGLQNAIDNIERPSLENYFNSVFNYKITSASGTVSTGGVINVPSVDFITSGVVVGDYVYAPVSQNSEGIFQVTQVVDSHTIVVDGSPVVGSIIFNVAGVFGASKTALQGMFLILQQCAAFSAPLDTWRIEVSQTIPVVSDPAATAYGLVPSDIAARVPLDIARQTQVTNAIAFITATLADTDKLYDSRYAWIDNRINLQTGILVQGQRAVANRLKAQQDALNAMIKLLAVQ
jgi:hypothetical protein